MNLRYIISIFHPELPPSGLILAIDIRLVIISMLLASILLLGVSAIIYKLSLWVWTIHCVV